MAENLYLPQIGKISKIEQPTKDIKIINIRLSSPLFIKPGQFVLVGLPGYGEATFGLVSPTFRRKEITILFRKVGFLTNKLFEVERGDKVTVRSRPIGKPLPWPEMIGSDLVLVAGGTGIAPIAGLADEIAASRKKFGQVYFLYGVACPEDLLLQEKLKYWEKKKIKIKLACEKPDKDWQGERGFVTSYIPNLEINPKKIFVLMVGPQPMYEPIAKEFKKIGLTQSQIYISLERRLRCGLGKCQHCTCNSHYLCLDGPFFTFDIAKKMGAI